MENRDRLERFAELIVGFGANVQPGQVVSISTELGKEELTRAVAAAAYGRGARFVDAVYFDPWIKRARIEHAAEKTLGYVPPWYGDRLLALGDERAARISLSGPVAPEALEGLDPARAARDALPWLKEINQIVDDRSTNWTGVPCPTPAWAGIAHPDLRPEPALERLWQEIVHVCRLDEPDPIAAWQARQDELVAAAGRITERRFDALHFEGPGTDLTIGLLPSSRWMTARFTTAWGLEHMANLPSEEVFTSPDAARAEGVVRSTKPLVLDDGALVRGLTVRFERGRAVAIDAEEGAEIIRGRCATDEGAARLGEVALVDRAGRIGALGTVFYSTLLDENAASHVAFGDGFDFVLDEEERARRAHSAIHIDFMIGGEEVDVSGITVAGERVPVLRGGDWQI